MSVNDNERPHALYCIGGSLDGQVRTHDESGFIAPVDRYRGEWYVIKGFGGTSGGPDVHYWVCQDIDSAEFTRRACDLYVSAAVLQDEQLICE